MRFLHTSDWHLGRSFGTASLAGDQAAFLDWLVTLVRDAGVELVVVAGDVYDRAVAPIEAIAMFRDTLRRLREAGAQVAVITGNHDGADRVASYERLTEPGGIFIRGGYGLAGDVVTLPFRDGPLDLVLLPYLDPPMAPDDFPDDDAGEPPTHDDRTRRARRTHASVLAGAAGLARRRLVSPRSIAVAHAFVDGGASSESERGLAVGGTGAVPASLFSGFSYVALGHLHKPQDVPGAARLRYSGTPLAYSFSEEHAKSVTLADLEPDGRVTTTEVPVPVGRPVRTLSGTLEALLASTPDAATRAAFVRARLTDTGVVLDARQRLSASYPHLVEVHQQVAELDEVARPREQPVFPMERVAEFWRASTRAEPAEAELALLTRALETAAREVA